MGQKRAESRIFWHQKPAGNKGNFVDIRVYLPYTTNHPVGTDKCQDSAAYGTTVPPIENSSGMRRYHNW
jgi:hypothetical protein